MIRKKTLPLLVSLVVLFFAVHLLQAVLPSGKVISQAQAKDLPTLHMEGLNTLLEQNSGKVVMLNFFATWCPPCREEIPAIVDSSKRFKGKNVVFVGLSVDEPKTKATVEKFVKQANIDYPVYMAGRDLLVRYNVGSIPHNVFYDTSGNLIISQPGQCDQDDIKLVVEELLHGN